MHAYMYTLYKSDTSHPALEIGSVNWFHFTENKSFVTKEKIQKNSDMFQI